MTAASAAASGSAAAALTTRTAAAGRFVSDESYILLPIARRTMKYIAHLVVAGSRCLLVGTPSRASALLMLACRYIALTEKRKIHGAMKNAG